MSKFKKLVAGALAAVICATSFAAPAPATADAADYCCHNIYLKKSEYCTTRTVGECCTFGVLGTPKGGRIPNVNLTCELKYNVYLYTYGCYKCNYTTQSYYSGNVYHSHGLCPNR